MVESSNWDSQLLNYVIEIGSMLFYHIVHPTTYHPFILSTKTRYNFPL
jgi:hypothetical protein